MEIHVSDDAEQTRLVMLAHARTVDGTHDDGPDLRPFLALQTWLETTAERRVVVPFARPLARMVPSTTVRMHRDFRQLLTAVQVAALLRQRHRAGSEDGAVIATLDDYAEARVLLAAVFDAVEADGLTPAIRATVEAVKPGEELTLGELAKRLGMKTSGAGYRAARAVKGGWLVDNDPRRNHNKFARGAPLPDTAVHALPTVDALRVASECPKDSGGDIAPPSPPVEHEVGEDDVDPDDEGEV